MKLLSAIPEYLPTSGGGIVTFYRQLLPALVRAGAQVTALVGSAVSQSGAIVERDGVRVVGLSEQRFSARMPRLPQLDTAPALRRHVAAAWALHDEARALGDFDAVEVADWGLLGVPWLLDGGVPVQVRCHGSAGQIAIHESAPGLLPVDQLMLAIERSLFARASCMVSHGQANPAQWSQWTGRECLHRGPALPLQPMSIVGQADWSLVLARVQRWKGPQVLGAALDSMQAPPAVRWAGRDVPDLGGVGSSTLAAVRRRSPRAWKETVDRHDTVDSGIAADWMRQARAVLVPSTWEVFNFAGAEAMAAGAVVLASDGAGMSRWIAHCESGMRFAAGDAASLAQALSEMLAMGRGRRERMGERARHCVAERADPGRIAAMELAAFRGMQSRAPVVDPLDALLRPMVASGGLDGMLAQYTLRALFAAQRRPNRAPPEGRMRQRPTLAVVIPARNAERFLPELLASISAQSEAFDEVVLCDDASSDRTAMLARAFGARVVQHVRNAGCSVAKNTGFAAVESDCVHFQDADDLMEPGFAQAVRDAIGPGIDARIPRWRHVDAASGMLLAESIVNVQLLSDDAVAWNILSTINNVGVYRCAQVRAVGGFTSDPEVLHNEDRAFHLALAEAGARFVAGNEVLVETRRSVGSMSVSNAVRCARAHGHNTRCHVARHPARHTRERAAAVWQAATGLAGLCCLADADPLVELASALGRPSDPAGRPRFRLLCRRGPRAALRLREYGIRVFKPELRGA